MNEKEYIEDYNLLNDEYILSVFINNGKFLIKQYKPFLNKHIAIKKYIENRYSDSQSTQETLYRMINNIEIRPICKSCGKPVSFNGYKGGFSTFCCSKCASNDPEVKQKVIQTSLIKYNALYPSQNKEVKQKQSKTINSKSIEQKKQASNKVKKTKLLKYGDENYNNHEKTSQTKLLKYGDKNYNNSEKQKQTCIANNGGIGFQSEKIKEKYIKTCQNLYNVNNGGGSEKAIEKIKEKWKLKTPEEFANIYKKHQNTCLLLYGETSYSKTLEYRKFVSDMVSSPEYQEHQLYIKKLRGTINSSKVEQQFKEYLEQNFPNDFEYQYRSELYPFNCDFYIKSLDLYIEIQGTWFHGGHPFNENNQEDIDKLNYWKEKNTPGYNQAVYRWSISDVNKRNIAKQNNLNYLEIFSDKINEVIKQFNEYIKH